MDLYEKYGKEHEIPLRPHHGMCLAYFEGKGYSEDFTAHMQEVLDFLTNEERAGEQEKQVRLTIGTDVICEACPHNEDGICDNDAQASEYDRKVLSLCGLKEGEVMTFQDFVSRVQDNIIADGKRTLICAGCQWEDICNHRPSRWT